MTLFAFITDLLEQGSVTLAGHIHTFAPDDTQAAIQSLQAFYNQDKPTMPHQAPDFQADAALWAAQHLYRAMQLTLLREIEAEKIPVHLPPFSGTLSAGAVYSADLMLRYLPDTLNLAKGLSPDDALVIHLKKTAAHWPFSSVGIPLEEPPDVSIILAHPSLRQAYLDRIIQKRDLQRARQATIQPGIQEALGSYGASLWPDFQVLI